MRGIKPNMQTDKAAVSEVPAPPRWFSKDAKAEWKRVVPILVERKILTEADMGGLENYCIAIGQIRETERLLQRDGSVIDTEKGPKRHPAVGIQSDAMTRSRLLAAELGLTPVSRSRPSIRDDEDADTLLD